MINYAKYVLLVCPFLVLSCFEKDTAVTPWPGEVITINEDIEEYFSYFDLETGSVVKSFPVDSWQISFECIEPGWHIQINSGDGWFLWNSGQTDIDADIIPPQGILWAYDKQSAYPDSTAAGNWVNIVGNDKIYTGYVYFLGKFVSGTYYDIKRLKFTLVDKDHYRFLMRSEDSGIQDTLNMTKSDTSSFIYFNIYNKTQVNLEPRKEQFDLIFGPYYDLATQLGVTIPYLVRGTFLNLWETSAVLDSVNAYEQITYEMLGNYVFTKQKDVIGYRWKDITIDPVSGRATYKVKPQYSYVINTSTGRYYKLRFLSFSIDGYSGFPRFEIKELKPLQ
jgi:hypothetical protein